VAAKLEKLGHTIIDLTVKGWTVTEENVAAVKTKIQEAKRTDLSPSIAVFMALDNSVYFGSERIGSRYPPARDTEGKYHVKGKMVMAEKTDLVEMVRQLIPLMNEVATMQKVFVTPLPRYIGRPCCAAAGHITNKDDPTFVEDVVEKTADYRRWARDTLHKMRVLGLRTVNPWPLLSANEDDNSSDAAEQTWAADGVHLVDRKYIKLAEELSNEIAMQINKPGAAPRAARRHSAESAGSRGGEQGGKRKSGPT